MSVVTRESLAPLLERLRLYSQPQRLAILACLTKGRHPVSDIEKLTGITQPALSQQLSELRRAGIITAHRASREVHYDFASPGEHERTLTVLSLLASTNHNRNEILSTSPQIGAQFAAVLDT